jgi:hypothetical protein
MTRAMRQPRCGALSAVGPQIDSSLARVYLGRQIDSRIVRGQRWLHSARGSLWPPRDGALPLARGCALCSRELHKARHVSESRPPSHALPVTPSESRPPSRALPVVPS